MTDLLVHLYPLEERRADSIEEKGIQIKRALAPDKHRVLEFVINTFSRGWGSECDVSFANNPISCFIAVQDKKVIGFACYDATARGFFGPTGVLAEFRGQGIGKALLFRTLQAMKEEGYAYAIIGWADEAQVFYERVVGAIPIENSTPGVYSRLIGME